MEHDVELAALKSTVEHGFREMHRRTDEQNVKLAVIDGKVTITNGTVIRHDEQIRTLFQQFKDAPKDVVTFSALKALKDYGGWIAAGVLGALKLMGKL